MKIIMNNKELINRLTQIDDMYESDDTIDPRVSKVIDALIEWLETTKESNEQQK